MRMAAGSVFADMELPEGETLFGALSDMSNFFYWLKLPAAITSKARCALTPP